MDKEKLKLIVRNMESLVNALKSEIYSDSSDYYANTNTSVNTKLFPGFEDYDEIFDDNCPN